MTTDPLPAAVRRYLRADAAVDVSPTYSRTLHAAAIDAQAAMSLALAQHGKVEALHAAAEVLADLGEKTWVDGEAFINARTAYRSAKAALAESNQEAVAVGTTGRAGADSGIQGGASLPSQASVAGDDWGPQSVGGGPSNSSRTEATASTSAPAMTADQRLRDASWALPSSLASQRVVDVGLAVSIAIKQIRAAETATREEERAKIAAYLDAADVARHAAQREAADLRARLAAQPAGWTEIKNDDTTWPEVGEAALIRAIDGTVSGFRDARRHCANGRWRGYHWYPWSALPPLPAAKAERKTAEDVIADVISEEAAAGVNTHELSRFIAAALRDEGLLNEVTP